MDTQSSLKVTSVMHFTHDKRVVDYLRLLRKYLPQQQAFMPTFRGVRCMLVLLAFFLPLQQASAQKVATLLHTTSTKAEGNDAFVFGFDRIFVSFKGSINEHAAYKIMVAFNKYFNKSLIARKPTDAAASSDFIDKDGETTTKTPSSRLPCRCRLLTDSNYLWAKRKQRRAWNSMHRLVS